MTTSAAQASAFFRDATRLCSVWTLRDAEGILAPKNGSGHRAMPFWSTRSRVEKAISNVVAYNGFEPVEIPLDDFTGKWLIGLEHDGLRVGLNWSDERATGYDLTPAEVASRLAAASVEPAEN